MRSKHVGTLNSAQRFPLTGVVSICSRKVIRVVLVAVS